jgi:iron complex transport system substrate-binding protein
MLRFAAAAALLLSGSASWAAPRRIVSLNPCVDAILVNLASPRQIAGISHYSRDPNASVIPQQAKRFRVTGPTAEAILAMKPDLVLAGRHTDLATRKALTRLKLPLVIFDTPKSVAESRAQIRRMAALVRNPAAGQRLIGRIDGALAAASSRAAIPALVHHPSGLTPGSGTLPDELLRRTGFRNMAASYGLQGWGRVGIETIVRSPPSLLLVSDGGGGTSAATWLAHPALRALKRNVRQVPLPAKLFYCGGPTIINAARALATIRAGQSR